jgi:hypothetical protein
VIPLRRLQFKEKNTSRIVLEKSFGLVFHETLLFLFWLYLAIDCIGEQTKFVMLEFYSNHLILGLLLLPTATKLLIVLPVIMTVFTFLMLSGRTEWEFDNLRQKLTRTRSLLLFLAVSKKEWAYKDAGYLAIEREKKHAPYVLWLVLGSGKRLFIDHCRNERRLYELVKQVHAHTGLKLLE